MSATQSAVTPISASSMAALRETAGLDHMVRNMNEHATHVNVT
jgi:hypothetical protein